MLPVDLVLLRHGQSEGNAARRRSETGDHSAFTPEFLARHSAAFRLTEKGRAQAAATGEWIRRNCFQDGAGFDRYITSEYIRAMETSALLDLPGAEWFTDFYLTERDWGDLEHCPLPERESKFGAALRRRIGEPFFWKPPNGESFAELCLRIDRFLHTLHRECAGKRVLAVCHGEVMRGFQVRIERMSQSRFRQVVLSPRDEDRIHNCQIIHYTRRDPETGALVPHADWVRCVRPAEVPFWTTGWRRISRPRYSNQDLLDLVSATPALIV
jgi:NAD+ kinase